MYICEAPTALDVNDLPDPRPALGKLNVADVNLEPFEILNLLRLISVAMGLRETFHNERDKFPLIREITETIPNLRALSTAARPHLAGWRDRGFRQPGAARGPLPDFKTPLANPAFARKYSEARRRGACAARRIITIRNERYVIPIRNDNRGAVAGVVHGMSSSGQTAFVEPLETIGLNNELVRLRELEQVEITKVLFSITEELREERAALEAMAACVGQLDFIAAKARMALAQNAIEPRINNVGRLALKDARHPLLEASLKAQGR